MKFARGEFIMKNPQKYCGVLTRKIEYRSSWEYVMMKKFDEHPDVLAWASESITIPYYNPLTRKQSMYVPDFFVVYADKYGKKRAELLEVKPAREHPNYVRKGKERISERTKLTQIINAAKWKAAMEYCARRRIGFKVITEEQMFGIRGK